MPSQAIPNSDLQEIKTDIKQVLTILAKHSERFDTMERHQNDLELMIKSVESDLSEKINSVDTKLSEKIDIVEEKLTKRIDNVESKLTEKIDELTDAVTYAIKKDAQQDKRLNRVENHLSLPKLTFAA